jgi:signal transduction histidine kinase
LKPENTPPEPFDVYAVLDSLPDGVSLADVEGRIFFSNRAAKRILGVGAAVGAAPEEWADYYGVFLPDGRTVFPTEDYPLVRALSGEHTRDVEMFVRNPVLEEGALISASGQPLLDSWGRVTGAAVVFRDVTELRRVQDELHAAVERLTTAQRLKDDLTGFVVHDLKSPLTAVVAGCHLLAAVGLPQQARDDLDSILEAAERINRMVMDLLDVQLAEDGALELELSTFGVRDLLEEVRRSSALILSQSGQRFEWGPLDDPLVVGDRPLVFRVLMNLVDNCVKYGPRGGAVWLEAEAGATDVVVSVRDEGPGVPVELRERIFEKYARAERDERIRAATSRGLGLRFCRVVMDAHGRGVWVEDGHPVGAKFCIRLARAD